MTKKKPYKDYVHENVCDVDKKIRHIICFMHWVLLMDFMGTITNTVHFMIDRYFIPNCKVHVHTIQFIA